MKKILITGSSGLIGSIIYQNLKHKYKFTGMDKVKNGDNTTLKTHVTSSNKLEDINSAFKNIDIVVHLAANASELTKWDLVLKNNIELTRNVFEASRLNGVSRVIFASSNHAVGNFEKDEPYKSIVKGKYKNVDSNNIEKINEKVPIRPDSNYGISKAFGEAMARYYYEHHNLESISLRIGTVIKDNSPKTNIRHYATLLYHEDLVQLIDKSISATNISSEIFYGVSNNTWRFWDITHAEKTIGYLPLKNAEDER
mgnify:FL=1